MASSTPFHVQAGELVKLTDNVFRNIDLATAATLPTAALRERVTVLTISPEAQQDEINQEKATRALFHYLMAAGASTSGTAAQWRTFVATVVVNGFTSFLDDIKRNSNMYTIVVLDVAQITKLRKWSSYAEKLSVETSAEARTTLEKGIKDNALNIKELPPLEATQDVAPGRSLDTAGVYGYLSLVLFLAGKSITSANRTAITMNRPKAIERKYFQEVEVPCLTGRLQLSHRAHVYVHSAFAAMTHFRSLVFSVVATFSGAQGDFPIEVVATTTRLMHYAGMQHVVMIDKFLSAHEEACKVPLLMSSLRSYVFSLEQLSKVDTSLKPFYKVIHGDTTRAFNRRDVENLIVVAVSDLETTTPTLANYVKGPNVVNIIEMYHKQLAALAAQEEED